MNTEKLNEPVKGPWFGLLASAPGANLQGVKKKPASSPAVATAPATPPVAAEPIRFKTNRIVPAEHVRAGATRFIVAGEPSPYFSLDEVPPSVRPCIMRPADFGSEPESDEPPSATFTLNTVYNVDENG